MSGRFSRYQDGREVVDNFDDNAAGFELSPLEALWENKAKRANEEATRAVNAAVANWAKQAGMTVDQWWEVYEARVEIVPEAGGPAIEGFRMTVRVTAHLRGAPHYVFERRPA